MQAYIQRIKNISKLFQNNDNFHAFHKVYRKDIEQGNVQMIADVILLIEATIRDDQCDPFSKLLALRFVKQVFACASYSFLTLFNSLICQILVDTVLQQKQSHIQGQRGEQIFMLYSSYDQLYLRRIGVSFYKMILEMYQAMSQILPFCPYNNEQQYKIPSNFYNHYKQLSNSNIQFPKEYTYFKNNDKQRIRKSIENNKSPKKQIQNFYQYLIKGIDVHEGEVYEIKKKIILKIIQSGDQYCVDYLIKFLQVEVEKCLQVQSSQFRYMNLIGLMIKSGDIESIIKIDKYLLYPLFKLSSDRKLSQNDTYQLASFGFLIQTIQDIHFQSYSQISDFLNVCSKEKLHTQLGNIKKNFKKQSQNNAIKLKYLQHKYQNMQLYNLIKKLKSAKAAELREKYNIESINIIPQPQQRLGMSIYISKNKKSRRLMSTQRKTSFQISLPKMQQNQNFQSVTSSNQNQLVSVKTPRSYHSTDHKSTMDKITSLNQLQIKDMVKSKKKIVTKIKLQINPNQLQKYKEKKRLLKKKNLLLRNQDMELGMITEVDKKNLVISFFCTANVDLYHLTFKINHSLIWLQSYQKPIHTIQKINAQSQKCFRFQFQSIENLQTNTNYEKPKLQFSFQKPKNEELFQYKIQLPINVNKLFENRQSKYEDFLQSTSSINEKEKSFLSKKINLDCKVCHRYLNFLNYFPYAIQVNTQNNFFALLSGLNIEFYFHMKMLGKNEALLQIIPKKFESRYQKVQQTLKVLLNLFCQIFSI